MRGGEAGAAASGAGGAAASAGGAAAGREVRSITIGLWHLGHVPVMDGTPTGSRSSGMLSLVEQAWQMISMVPFS